MEINAALAADLALLSAALDEPGVNIAETVEQLAADARLAVGSYIGLRVSTTGEEPVFTFTLLEVAKVRSSLLIPLTRFGRSGAMPTLSVILYAGRDGAFVDLAADLSWLAGTAFGDVVIDEHLDVHQDSVVPQLEAESVINQAIGVLFSRGLTPQEADRELDIRANEAGIDRRSAADRLLGEV